MLHRQPGARESAHFRQHLAEHRARQLLSVGIRPVEGCDGFLRLIPSRQVVGD
jgi:hypothetical protein